VTGAARDLGGQNVRYAELTVTPHTFTKEGMPAAEITEALDIGAAEARREHGVRIGVCTGQVPDLASPPLPRLLAEGLFATLNSDDPPMFGTSLTQEYRRAAAELGLDRDQLASLARNGVRAAFLDAAAKQALLDEIDEVASRAAAAHGLRRWRRCSCAASSGATIQSTQP
jgi:adenosine deaminase